jgi:uncharacterized membrane protein YphA (DoxX/SURF4 family)
MRRPGPSLAPLLLRVVLGGIILWFGLVKIESKAPVAPADAASLANMGVAEAQNAAQNITLPSAGAPSNAGRVTAPPGTPASDINKQTESGTGAGLVQPPTTKGTTIYVADQYAEPIRVTRVYSDAILIRTAGYPKPAVEGGIVPKSIWPRSLASGRWPIYLAWTVAILELVCGAFVILGIVSRVCAGCIVLILSGGLWLTQFGPSWRDGDVILGFIPAHTSYSMVEWMPLLFHVCMLTMALAIVLTGPGVASFDRRLFPPPPPPPNPKPLL